LRNWIEYGFKQVKSELGWADFRLTDYSSIERWWKFIFSVYLIVSLHAQHFCWQALLPTEEMPLSGADDSFDTHSIGNGNLTGKAR
jgi:hypothetical protein